MQNSQSKLMTRGALWIFSPCSHCVIAITFCRQKWSHNSALFCFLIMKVIFVRMWILLLVVGFESKWLFTKNKMHEVPHPHKIIPKKSISKTLKWSFTYKQHARGPPQNHSWKFDLTPFQTGIFKINAGFAEKSGNNH